MKKSEVIRAYYKEILDAMISRYETVVRCGGSVQYKVYIWSDGQVECLEGVQGDNSWLKARDAETRELYYVTTVGGQVIDLWDCADHSAPDDEAEREAEEEDIIDWLVGEYEHEGAEAQLDAALEQAEQEERY